MSADGSVTAYVAPSMRTLGVVSQLTQADCVDKTWGPADGHTLMGVAIRCNTSA